MLPYIQIFGPSRKLRRTLFTVLSALVMLVIANVAQAASNNFPSGNCTWGAAQCFNQTAPAPGVNWGGNANMWLWNAAAAGWDARTLPTSVQPGAIMCWTGGSDRLGHVAYVCAVDWPHRLIQIQEMNWAAFRQWDRRWLPMSNPNRQGKTATYYFAGYINPAWSRSCRIPRP